MSKFKKTEQNIQFIDGFGSLSNYSEENGIVKTSGLILAEGDWTDSKGRKHSFPKERILLIQHNSNASFNSGKDIPILQDHKKEVSSYSGEVEKEFIVRPINPEDLPQNKRDRLGGLIGKLGIFAEGIKITAKEAVQKYKDGLKTISPGIDIVNDVIREISMTPTPAIQGMALYMKGNVRPLTWEEAEESNVELEKLEEEFESLSEKFFDLVSNIYTASEDELVERDPLELISINLDDYVGRLTELFGLNELQEDQEQQPLDPQTEQQMRDLSQYSMAYHAENNAEFKKGFSLGKLVSKIGGRGSRRQYGKAVKSLDENVATPLKNRYTNIEMSPEYGTGGRVRMNTKRVPKYDRIGRDAAIGAGGIGALGAGAYVGNRYLNPNSGRNKRKRYEQSPLGRLQRGLGM
jgi:hypothetical protein